MQQNIIYELEPHRRTFANDPSRVWFCNDEALVKYKKDKKEPSLQPGHWYS